MKDIGIDVSLSENSKLVTAHVPYQAGSMGIKVSGIIGQVDVATRVSVACLLKNPS